MSDKPNLKSVKCSDGDQFEDELGDFETNCDFEPGANRASAYVQVFETMVRTVLECESYLLSVEEIEILQHFSNLSYNARYCLVRLLLRTPNRWYPTSSLESFKKEVGEGGLTTAIEDICSHFSQPGDRGREEIVDVDPPDIKQEDTVEVIDLSMESDDEIMKPNSIAVASPATKDEPFTDTFSFSQPAESDPIRSLLLSDVLTMTMDSFCQSESVMTTREILERTNREHLGSLAKEMKCAVRPNSKKDIIIEALERQAASQQVLEFGTSLRQRKGKARADGLQQTHLSFSNPRKQKKTQQQRLRELAMKCLGPCIRVHIEFIRLMRRLHIVYFRETEYPTSLLLSALLSTFKKRNFTPVSYKRTDQVWTSRKELLEYERALELDKLLDDVMEEQKDATSKGSAKITKPKKEGTARDLGNPHKSARDDHIRSVQPKYDCASEGATSIFENLDLDELISTSAEQVMRKHFEDWIYTGWQDLVAIEDGGVRPRPIGLERFDAGHVYTRMVHKALKVIAKIKDYDFEIKVLESLLDQRFWCRGKRAKWHIRKAIVLGHLITKEKTMAKKRDLQLRVLEGIKEALLDDDTGIVYRPNLVKRLRDLEHKLKIPLDERSQCSGELKDAPFITLKAVRVPPSLGTSGRPKNEKENTPNLNGYLRVTQKSVGENKPKISGKSSWQGRDGQIVNVETRALEHYEDEGYKGFHCETSILTTLFGLLFWDIIFAEVVGAFETPYQTSPLDLLYDTFYRARKDMINERLQEIQDGRAREILEMHDRTNRDDSVLCIGVNWEFCSREDLLDIVDCIGGNTLAIICQIFCEDYEGRRSGGPDLFIWNTQLRKSKFVEVKGPGDTPQENQKLWFDSLLRANANVEICYVKDIAQQNDKKPRKNASSSGRRKRVSVAKGHEEDFEKLDCEDDVENPIVDECLESKRPSKRPRIST